MVGTTLCEKRSPNRVVIGLRKSGRCAKHHSECEGLSPSPKGRWFLWGRMPSLSTMGRVVLVHGGEQLCKRKVPRLRPKLACGSVGGV